MITYRFYFKRNLSSLHILRAVSSTACLWWESLGGRITEQTFLYVCSGLGINVFILYFWLQHSRFQISSTSKFLLSSISHNTTYSLSAPCHELPNFKTPHLCQGLVTVTPHTALRRKGLLRTRAQRQRWPSIKQPPPSWAVGVFTLQALCLLITQAKALFQFLTNRLIPWHEAKQSWVKYESTEQTINLTWHFFFVANANMTEWHHKRL